MSFRAHDCDWRGQPNAMSRKTVILTEIIAPYRIPVFNVLASRAGLDLHVIFLAETDEILRQWRIHKDEICFSHSILPSWRWRAGRTSFLINRGLWSALNKADPQVIICGGFVVPGKASFEYLKMLGCVEASISIAPNAVDNSFFATRAESTIGHATEFRDRLKLPSRFILFVGRLVPEKGVFDLLQAYAKLESDVRSEVGLVFAGNGSSGVELAQQAKRINPGVVCFPGFAQREDLAGLYALAECLVLPTHSDPWGLVVNEAMACGLPIIVSSVAGCSADLVEDGWN